MRPLEKHIIDTVKEWQMKIGCREGSMNLYYPADALAELLELPEAVGKADVQERRLAQALSEFVREAAPRLGQLQISHEGERYCFVVPDKGCSYVAQEVPDSEFLGQLLGVITIPGNHLDEVEACFAEYARTHGGSYVSQEAHHHGLGRVFYFQWEEETLSEAQDPYVYCVEDDEFGLTYHRFTQTEYRRMR